MALTPTPKSNTYDEKAHPVEEAKLLQEIRALIERKGLSAELVDQTPKASASQQTAEHLVVAGCSTCTLCPCMICW